MIAGLDFVAVPSQDAERSRAFYVDTLGLRPDGLRALSSGPRHVLRDLGAGAPGLGFAPQRNARLALHVDDVAAARAELEAEGVRFAGETLDTGACHMALFADPDGNDLMLHHRYAPRG